ncbi:hypothetical protein [Nocardioides sp. SYSU DS0651]|uniref:hypothetical protein n=1 Tax=Nocardioides sp. SYSU DS0651 TaxID=3415955 RepID=UPI003F4AFFA9
MGAKASGQPLAALADLLGVREAELEPVLGPYDAAQVAVLEAAVSEALAGEDAAFDRATQDAVRHVPRLLRGPARKLLLGGRYG